MFTDRELISEIPMLRKMARILIRDVDREDLVQDTLELAIKHRGRFEEDGEGSLAKWLSVVIRNRATTLYRDRKGWVNKTDSLTKLLTEKERTEIVDILDHRSDAVSRVFATEVAELADQLSGRERQLMVQVAYGLTYEELAEEFGVKVSSIGSMLHRARSKLEDLVDTGFVKTNKEKVKREAEEAVVMDLAA